MRTLKDSSEIKEAARLLEGLFGKPPAEAKPAPAKVPAPHKAEPKPAPTRPEAAPAPAPAPLPVDAKKSDRLDHVLETMCKRGGFIGAVIADRHGLPLSVYNSPVGTDAMAAFSLVLGDALDKASPLLKQSEANNITIDLNYTDKVVLHRFSAGGFRYYLMVICLQETDERSEIELSVTQLVTLLQ